MRSDAPEHPLVNPWIIALSVMFATFMEVLDTTVVNVSLPHIAGSLSATVEEATWALTSYLVANAVILPITGWLANHFGRKRILMLAVTGFTTASFLCGFAPNLEFLIACRILQGATGGALQPMSQAVMLEAFRPEDRGKAMAFWALGVVVAPILGPVLGGWLTDSYSWRWIFYINIPIGLVSLLMTKLFIFDPPYIRRSEAPVDYWGIGMLTVGIGALQVLLDKGQEEDWFSSHAMVVLAIVSATGLIAFVIRELKILDPVVDLYVLRDRTYSTGVFLMTVIGFVLYGSLVLLPIMLQTLFGYPAVQAGIALAPRGIGSFLAMPIMGMIVSRFGPRKLLTVGLIGGSVTLFWFGELNLNTGYWDLFWPQFIQGAALSLVFVPLTTITMNAISKERMGNATSIFNLMRNLGGSVGIATATTILARNQQAQINQLGSYVNPYNQQTNRMFEQLRSAFLARGADALTATRSAYAALFGMVQQQAAIVSFVHVFRLMGIIFVLMLPLLLLMKSPKRGGAAPPVH